MNTNKQIFFLKQNILLVVVALIILVTAFLLLSGNLGNEKPLTLEEKENILKSLDKNTNSLTLEEKENILSNIIEDINGRQDITEEEKLEILNSLTK
jgi:hypothetical protein